MLLNLLFPAALKSLWTSPPSFNFTSSGGAPGGWLLIEFPADYTVAGQEKERKSVDGTGVLWKFKLLTGVSRAKKPLKINQNLLNFFHVPSSAATDLHAMPASHNSHGRLNLLLSHKPVAAKDIQKRLYYPSIPAFIYICQLLLIQPNIDDYYPLLSIIMGS